MDRKICSFCGNDVEPGTGKMFVKADGTIFSYCSSKCQKNMLDLNRVPRRTRWTSKYEKKVLAPKMEKETKSKKPAVKKPIAKKPAAKKPAEGKSPAKKPEGKKPAESKSPSKAKKPAAKKPAVKKPAAKKA